MAADPDLYRRLAVDRGAGAAEIHRAYRRAAKRAHPDAAAGDAETWGALAQAYDVLRDPRRRQRYDDTGEIEGSEPDTHQATILMRIAVVMDQIAARAPQLGQRLAQIDWLSSIRSTLDAEIANIRQGLPALRKLGDDWEGVAARAHVDEGRVNVLRAIATGKAEECRRRIGQAEKEIADREEAKALLAGHRFDAERPGYPPPPGALPGFLAWSKPQDGRMW